MNGRKAKRLRREVANLAVAIQKQTGSQVKNGYLHLRNSRSMINHAGAFMPAGPGTRISIGSRRMYRLLKKGVPRHKAFDAAFHIDDKDTDAVLARDDA